jgi:hypothetical protein
MTRRELREHVFMQLFTTQFYAESEDDRSEQMQLYFSHAEGDGLDYPPALLTQEEQEEILAKIEKAKLMKQHMQYNQEHQTSTVAAPQGEGGDFAGGGGGDFGGGDFGGGGGADEFVSPMADFGGGGDMGAEADMGGGSAEAGAEDFA